MTPLRQRMLQDMQMRNLSTHTHEACIRAVAKLAAFYKTSPDRLDLEQVRAFLVHLSGQQVSFGLFNQTRCALVFFYRITLGRDWNFRTLLQACWQKEWVVYAKPPFGGPAQVLK